MINANIIEDPGPDLTRSDRPLERRTHRLSSTERDYFRRRAIHEAEAARAAACSEARLAHEEMAEAYWLLCRSRQSRAHPHSASELAIVLRNSKPTD